MFEIDIHMFKYKEVHLGLAGPSWNDYRSGVPRYNSSDTCGIALTTKNLAG